MSHIEWIWSLMHGCAGKVIDKQSLWGQVVYKVWLPDKDVVVTLAGDQLKPLGEQSAVSVEQIKYIATAAKIADAISRENILLAPIESAVIPLPHQINVLSKAINGDQVRYLLADEVGLGKTIEAGLIIKELKLRGLLKRVLILTPSGLTNQWVSEMQVHFSEEFIKIDPGVFSVAENLFKTDNLWTVHDQVICSMDTVKPMDRRRGWSQERVAAYNKQRFEDMVTAGWDMIIVDEAHRLGGSSDSVARYKLGKALSDAAPYMLLLSATPHQGKTDGFYRLMNILEHDDFPDQQSVTRERVQPYVVRTEKRNAIDHNGEKLFNPRNTQLVPIEWKPQHSKQKLLYDAVTEYVRQGYNQAVLEKKSYIGFLMILMQRLIASSTRAIRTTLEKRLEVLQAQSSNSYLFPELENDDFADMDDQDLINALAEMRTEALKNERQEVAILLKAAHECEQVETDAKAEVLLEWIYKLQQKESDPDLKVLIFTSFLPTQDMLTEFLESRGMSVVCLNGSMGIDDRQKAQKDFAKNRQIMISTEAGGEGLNLQFCHVVINYDLPWNPMKIEQRIGRVDRIGQKKDVCAINFVFEDTVEYRVREVLEQKLQVIFDEFGVDKTSDVLDSLQAGKMFDDVYINSIVNPNELDKNVSKLVNDIRIQVEVEKSSQSLFDSTDKLNIEQSKRIMNHPLPHWVEQMTINYLNSNGGKVAGKKGVYNISWPDGHTLEDVVFNSEASEKVPGSTHLTLEDSRIRKLIQKFSDWANRTHIPSLRLGNISKGIEGLWTLWQVGIGRDAIKDKRIIPCFIHSDGRVLQPTAMKIWDILLIDNNFELGDRTEFSIDRIEGKAQDMAKSLFEDLVNANNQLVEKQKIKGEYSFSARHRVISNIGLPEVKNYRLNKLEESYKKWKCDIEKQSLVVPELKLLLALFIEDKR